MNLVYTMPRLSSLAIAFTTLGKHLKWKLAFPEKTTITSLELKSKGRGNCENISYADLIRALPNLKRLKMSEIYDEEYLALGPALESLEVICFSLTRFPEHNFFPNIKELKVAAFNLDLRPPAEDNNFTAMINERMGVFFERYYFWSSSDYESSE